MKEAMSPEAAAERIRNALDLMKKNGSHLENILNSFSALLIEQARLKAELSSDNIFVKKYEYDRERLGKGAPLTSREKLIGIGNMWKLGIERLMPPMMTGFPNIAEQLEKLKSSITSDNFDLDLYAAEVLEEANPNTPETASDSAVDRGIVKFVLIHISKPFVEKRAETLKPFTDGLFWERGYCPICGSLPELSILWEKEGRRRLKCGFCRHEWPFMRTACPCCGTQENGNAENLFIDGREHERLDLCLNCRKYVAEIDIRAAIEEPVLEIVGIGLLHLEVLARKRGFLSMGGIWGSVM